MWTILFIGLVLISVWLGWLYLQTHYFAKQHATLLDSHDFEEQGRGHQIIDLRDAGAFKVKHVFGARNIPYAMLQENHAALRRDKPVFLYDSNMQLASRMAKKLHKDGYENIYILKGGFTMYDGRTKSNQS
ncbi:rhodanese-like domain-containing protein [Weissella halotolerans]|uniref:Rhodanese family protein n=1 Tax=Weissella halotolerans DSM 20190 TaxID=1123500 RepID=A0A0R2G6W7_9LACO|nr:rhodanese-like domain-containing protein [Weissella halotolerans]KRN32461.1 rhodanese family protein [Weissella halotolerans DSM 20190]